MLALLPHGSSRHAVPFLHELPGKSVPASLTVRRLQLGLPWFSPLSCWQLLIATCPEARAGAHRRLNAKWSSSSTYSSSVFRALIQSMEDTEGACEAEGIIQNSLLASGFNGLLFSVMVLDSLPKVE